MKKLKDLLKSLEKDRSSLQVHEQSVNDIPLIKLVCVPGYVKADGKVVNAHIGIRKV